MSASPPAVTPLALAPLALTTLEDLRRACAALPQSRETFPFDMTTLVFKVGKKMYALTDIEAQEISVSLKVKPERGEALRAEYEGVTPGYHLNKRHWVTVRLGQVPDELALELLRDSYDLVVRGMTRAEREALQGDPTA